MRRLPQSAAATFLVLGAPAIGVSLLSASGSVTSFLPLAAAGLVLSLAASCLGAAIWKRRERAGDMVFADLMLWGWLRRRRAERQVASAAGLLRQLESRDDRQPGIAAARRVRRLKRLAGALDARYPETQGHSRRVARHAAAIAKRMGLAAEQVARIRTAAAVHDVGKIAISAAIVEKPGPLSDSEYAEVKRHAEIGAEMVAGLGDGELARIVRHHHERLDGAGYPDGLSGDRIPLGARIIAVADTFDAITSTRPYRTALRHKVALALLAEEAGSQLDPGVVRAFRSYYSGHRRVAAWALALNGPRQLLASLVGEAKLAGTVTAATLATVAAGGAVIPPAHADRQPSPSDPAAPPAATAGSEPFAPGEGGAAPQRGSRSQLAGHYRGTTGGDQDGHAPTASAGPLPATEGTSTAAADPEGSSASPAPDGGGGRTPKGGAGGGERPGSTTASSNDAVDAGRSDNDDETKRLLPTVSSTVHGVVDGVNETVQEPTSVVDRTTDTVKSVLPNLAGDRD
jgi:HD-GYP domain-containing protein (c-di-GMP phosphodiesterase class II)